MAAGAEHRPTTTCWRMGSISSAQSDHIRIANTTIECVGVVRRGLEVARWVAGGNQGGLSGGDCGRAARVQVFRLSVISQQAVQQLIEYGFLRYGHHRSWQCGSFLPVDRLHKISHSLRAGLDLPLASGNS